MSVHPGLAIHSHLPVETRLRLAELIQQERYHRDRISHHLGRGEADEAIASLERREAAAREIAQIEAANALNIHAAEQVAVLDQFAQAAARSVPKGGDA